jgi:hypothetical protein
LAVRPTTKTGFSLMEKTLAISASQHVSFHDRRCSVSGPSSMQCKAKWASDLEALQGQFVRTSPLSLSIRGFCATPRLAFTTWPSPPHPALFFLFPSERRLLQPGSRGGNPAFEGTGTQVPESSQRPLPFLELARKKES